MNKAELVEELVNSKNFPTKADAERSLNAILEGILAGLKKDKKVQLVGFGTFNVKSYAARESINPATKAPMKIPARTSVSFKAGQKLKESL